MSTKDFDLTEEVLGLILSGEMKLHEDIMLIEPLEYEKLGMFYVPGKYGAKDMETTTVQGIVKAIGKGRVSNEGVFIPVDIKVGDKVLLKRGACMHQVVKDKTWLITRCDEIDAIIED